MFVTGAVWPTESKAVDACGATGVNLWDPLGPHASRVLEFTPSRSRRIICNTATLASRVLKFTPSRSLAVARKTATQAFWGLRVTSIPSPKAEASFTRNGSQWGDSQVYGATSVVG